MKQTMEYVNSDTMNFRRQPGHVTIKVTANENIDAYDWFIKLTRKLANEAADFDFQIHNKEYTIMVHPYVVND